MTNGDEVKIQMSLDDKTICKIGKLSSSLNMSMGDAIRFMIKHYLKFLVTGGKAKHSKHKDIISAATMGRSLLKQAAVSLNERFDHEDRDNSEKANLIEILKINIAEKEKVIDGLTSDLVFISKRLNNANKILGGVEDLILCSER